MITISNLSKKYGKHDVLNNIHFNFEKGKAYGILGENGAGKTTLFRCVAGLESFEGQITSEVMPLKSSLGYLPTNPLFLPYITGWEYLKLLCNARQINEIDFESKNIFELPLNEYASNYSTGMKKKLALLGILFQNNDVFILDEPYNGVDIHSNIIITAIIQELKILNKTILISSHIYSVIKDTCDEMFYLEGGIIKQHVSTTDFDSFERNLRSTIKQKSITRLSLK